jgi:hypothetical protein
VAKRDLIFSRGCFQKLSERLVSGVKQRMQSGHWDNTCECSLLGSSEHEEPRKYREVLVTIATAHVCPAWNISESKCSSTPEIYRY